MTNIEYDEDEDHTIFWDCPRLVAMDLLPPTEREGLEDALEQGIGPYLDHLKSINPGRFDLTYKNLLRFQKARSMLLEMKPGSDFMKDCEKDMERLREKTRRYGK